MMKPITTEKAIRLIELDNILIFEVDPRDNKTKIAKDFAKIFKVKVEKVNTLIDTKGRKKAYLKLSPETPAIDIATQMGMI